MEIMMCAWYWMFVAFAAGLFVCWCACNSMPKPELTERQLSEVIKKIIAEYPDDPDACITMIEELLAWLDWEDEISMHHPELIRMIKEVKKGITLRTILNRNR